jgi:hypothetical protein
MSVGKGKFQASASLIATAAISTALTVVTIKDPLLFICNAVAILFLMLFVFATLIRDAFRRDSFGVIVSLFAFAVLGIPFVALKIRKETTLFEQAQLWIQHARFEKCKQVAKPNPTGVALSVCDSSEIFDRWAEWDALVYDGNDEIVMAPDARSDRWWAVAKKSHMPFDELAFTAMPLGDHFYSVRFYEEDAVFHK